MGRKTDVKAIFQIGKNNNYYVWDSKYFEKKKESNIFIFQSVEIKKFIEKKLKDSGLILKTCKIKYLESTLKIFVSYLKLSNSSNIRLEKNRKMRLVKNRHRKEGIKNSILKIKKQMKIYRKMKKYFELKKIYLDLTSSQKRELKKEVKKAKIERLLNIFKIAKSHSKNRKALFEKIITYMSKTLPLFGKSLDVKKTISKTIKLIFSIRTRIEKLTKIKKLRRRLYFIEFIKYTKSIKRVRRFAKFALKSLRVNKLKKKRLQKLILQLSHKSNRAKKKFTESKKISPMKLRLKSLRVNKLKKKRLLKFIYQVFEDHINLQKKFANKIDFVTNLKRYDVLMKLFMKYLLSQIRYRKVLLRKCRFDIKMGQEFLLKVIKKFFSVNKRSNKKWNVCYSWNCVNFLKKKLIKSFIFNKSLKYIPQSLSNKAVENEKNLEKQIITNRVVKNKKILKKRIRILQYYKYYVAIKNSKIIKNMKTDNFLEKLIESLKIFTNNKFKILLNFQQVNKNLKYQLNRGDLSHFRSILSRLRRFKRNDYFKEGVHTIFFFATGKKSLNLLSNFISNNLTRDKKHRFFLRFLTQTLTIMLKSKWSKIKSVKIIINGRFFGRSRSSERTIAIDKNISFTKLKSDIDFSKTTAYGSDGTFGVKMWVNEK